jgi:division protein CdvB (Snf7/Vps24/ESCRT-III family)
MSEEMLKDVKAQLKEIVDKYGAQLAQGDLRMYFILNHIAECIVLIEQEEKYLEWRSELRKEVEVK